MHFPYEIAIICLLTGIISLLTVWKVPIRAFPFVPEKTEKVFIVAGSILVIFFGLLDIFTMHL